MSSVALTTWTLGSLFLAAIETHRFKRIPLYYGCDVIYAVYQWFSKWGAGTPNESPSKLIIKISLTDNSSCGSVTNTYSFGGFDAKWFENHWYIWREACLPWNDARGRAQLKQNQNQKNSFRFWIRLVVENGLKGLKASYVHQYQ